MLFLRLAVFSLFLCLIFTGSAPGLSAQTLEPLLTKIDAKRAATFLKTPKLGAALPENLQNSQHAQELMRLHDWLSFQDNRLGDFEDRDLVTAAQRLVGLPRTSVIKRKVEAALTFQSDPKLLKQWFDQNSPLTGKGQLLHAHAASAALGNAADYAKTFKSGWGRAWLDFDEEDAFLAQYGRFLNPDDHLKRIRFLLAYQGYSAARRMIPRLSNDQQALHAARLALRGFQRGVDGAINRVPDAQQSDPSLILDRAHWRRAKKKDEAAMSLLTADLDPMALIRPERLWKERHFWIRRLIKDQDYPRAYEMAASHGLDDRAGRGLSVKVAYADAEWIAGWIALRFLDKPELSFPHFKRMYDAVSTPVSRTRGAYWLGRASAALGDTKGANEWFRAAASMPHRYYGRLAAENLAVPPKVTPLTVSHVAPVDPDAAFAALLKSDDVRALRLLKDAERHDAVGWYIGALAAAQETPEEVYLLSRLGAALGRPDLPLRVAKKLEAKGIIYSDAGYPTIKLGKTLRKRAPLIHAIARQESVFNPTVVSRAGARGLMQLMPATARRMARENNLRYDFAALTKAPDYNMALSNHYLGVLSELFGDTEPLMAASYNAGENAVSRWVNDYGDPRDLTINPVDWMELIPYSETRNYVQRVMEAYIVYRRKFDGKDSVSLHRILSGAAPAAGG